MSQHPSEQQLQAFASGKFGGNERSEVEQHVDSCEDCARRITEFRARNERRNALKEVPQANPDGRMTSSEKSAEDADATVGLDQTPVEIIVARAADRDESPRQIGPYKILQPIGRGGMGQVYMAEQKRPVKRRVALKIIKTDTPTREILARFEAERQALAMMDHENIAKVLDAGITDEGRPYFAMELVKGLPITAYCDKNRSSLDERLQLYVQACRAIQHAHTKGIVHRDIKPTNVLVTLQDDDPVAKVIDFGLAKALFDQSLLTDRTIFTQHGQVVGTLEYMSPEQAALNVPDVDTRTDVYSLGVLLYELLTGSTPIGRERLKQEAFDRILRMIRENEPPRPSTRLSNSGDAIFSISERRGIEPSRLSRILKGDLDWIAMKALEKDRTRRYATPAAIVDDVQRYLSGEAIAARPPSWGYRLRKAIGKNSAAFTVGVGVFAMLLIGLFVSITMWLKASKAEVMAESARQLAEQRRKSIEDQLYASRAVRVDLGALTRVLVKESTTWDTILIGPSPPPVTLRFDFEGDDGEERILFEERLLLPLSTPAWLAIGLPVEESNDEISVFWQGRSGKELCIFRRRIPKVAQLMWGEDENVPPSGDSQWTKMKSGTDPDEGYRMGIFYENGTRLTSKISLDLSTPIMKPLKEQVTSFVGDASQSKRFGIRFVKREGVNGMKRLGDPASGKIEYSKNGFSANLVEQSLVGENSSSFGYRMQLAAMEPHSLSMQIVFIENDTRLIDCQIISISDGASQIVWPSVSNRFSPIWLDEPHSQYGLEVEVYDE